MVYFAGRDMSSGLSKMLVIASRCSGSGFMFEWGVYIFERCFPKEFALSISDDFFEIL